MRHIGLAMAIAASLISGCHKAESPRQFSQEALDKALADPGRKQDRDTADARRKPGPLIALAGVAPGDKVLDLIPGSGYWTRIFSKVVGPEGKVYAVWPQAYARYAMGNVADPNLLNKAVFKILKPGGTYMIVDHMAKAGRGMADTEKLHRIDPAIV